MSKHFDGSTEGETPKANWPGIYKECAKHKKFGIKVMGESEYITERQRRWYHGVCLPHLVKNDENGETKDWWDRKLKSECGGLAYLKKEAVVVELTLGGDSRLVTIDRITTKNVGRKNMTNYIEEILSQSIHKGWGVAAPDEELRSKKHAQL